MLKISDVVSLENCVFPFVSSFRVLSWYIQDPFQSHPLLSRWFWLSWFHRMIFFFFFFHLSRGKNGFICIHLHCISLTQLWNDLSITHTSATDSLPTETLESVPLPDSFSSSLTNCVPHNKSLMFPKCNLLASGKCQRVLFCVCFVFQCREWRAAKREVLVCGPAAGVWDHPSGKRPTQTSGSVGDTQNHMLI